MGGQRMAGKAPVPKHAGKAAAPIQPILRGMARLLRLEGGQTAWISASSGALAPTGYDRAWDAAGVGRIGRRGRSSGVEGGFPQTL
jgi:hypothetical protein